MPRRASPFARRAGPGRPATLPELRERLAALDGRGYAAYGDLEGAYDDGSFLLILDHAQPDPFASPSRLRARVALARSDFPAEIAAHRARRTAAEDFVARAFRDAIGTGAVTTPGAAAPGAAVHPDGRRGPRLHIDAGGQEVLERTAVRLTPEWIEARFTAQLPAAGRRILAREAARLLLEEIPRAVAASLFFRALDAERFGRHLDAVEDQQALRGQLAEKGLVAFVADGAILPRRSGVDERPLAGEAIPFSSPPALRAVLRAPHRGEVTGMGIPAGVTLIAGGGFHGKSTLLRALERGVYDHVPGDGRELVVTIPGAVKIRAEDGRRVERTDISPFIRGLPFGRDTERFSTEDASGSTSQAANIMEALELGARALLMDEDTSATNFMIRDARMQALVAKEREPITPYLDRVRQLADEHAVSTVLVMGGSGDYLDAADTVILMDHYQPLEVTAQAREVARAHATGRRAEGDERFGPLPAPRPLPRSLAARRGAREARIACRGRETILVGATALDLSALEQLVDASQTRAIGLALGQLAARAPETRDGPALGLCAALRELEEILDREGLDWLSPGRIVGDLARPRLFELGAALNRMRTRPPEG